MSKKEEGAFLAPFLEKAAYGGILVVGEIKRVLDAHLNKKVPLSSVYNLLHRHNWLKIDNQWKGKEKLCVMFQGEARFGRISDVRRCWCPVTYSSLVYVYDGQRIHLCVCSVSVGDG